MSTVSEETLSGCLELLSQGLTIEQIMARYPDQGEALRPLLETAVQLSKLATRPTLAAKERSSRAMLHRAAEMRTARRSPAPIRLMLRRLLMPVGSFAAVLFLIGAMLLIKSASSVPGDGLYGAKQLVERARLAPVADPEARSALLEAFNQERIREVEVLLRSGRDAEVRFQGVIGEITPDHWTVAGLRLEVSDETTIDGDPHSDAVAQAYGRTHEGKLTALLIVVEADDLPAPQGQALASVINGLVGGDVPSWRYLAGAGLGALLAFSGLGGVGVQIGLGFYMPFDIVLTYTIGCVARIVTDKIKGNKFVYDVGIPVAAGLIVGEALVGVGYAFFKILSAPASALGGM